MGRNRGGGADEFKKLIVRQSSDEAKSRNMLIIFLVIALLALISHVPSSLPSSSLPTDASFSDEESDDSAVEKKEAPETGVIRTKDDTGIDYAQFETCEQMKFNVSQPANSEAKPIWFIILPNEVSNGLHQSLINTMTGLSAGASSYIASSKTFRHCVGNGQTATCMANSAMASVGSKKLDFYEKSITHLRNPITGFPARFNMKSKLYRGLKGQSPINNWRAVRDDWSAGMVGEFTDGIDLLKDAKFQTGLYLVHEDLLDIAKGVEVLKKVRKLLIEAGLNVVPESELSCVWYLALGRETIENYHKTGYEYGDYVPGYTDEQKVKFLKEMKEYRSKIENDDELAEIFDRYTEEIDTKTVIDNKHATPKDRK